MDLPGLFASNRFHEIITHYESLDGFVFEDNPGESNVLAASYFKSGSFQKAYEVLVNLESALYNDPDYLSLFGATCRRLMLLDKAKLYFMRAIELNPNSIQYKNNYSNLLIDLGEIHEAVSILEPIVLSNPNYSDALENLNRAKFLLESPSNSNNSSVSVQELQSFTDTVDLWDPMLIAFSDEEVAQYGRIKDKVQLASTTNQQKVILPSIDSDTLVSEYYQLTLKAIVDKDYVMALDLCTKIHQSSTSMSLTYATSSDAYIALKRFHEAEICILTSIVLSEPNSVQYLNLSSLVSVRGDFKLAFLYLDKAAALDPSNPLLDKVRSNLNKLSSKNSVFNFLEPWSTHVK